MKFSVLSLGICTVFTLTLTATCDLITPGQIISTGQNPMIVQFAFPGNCLAVLNSNNESLIPLSDVSMLSLNSSTNQFAKVTGPNANGNYDTNLEFATSLAISPLGTAIAVGGTMPNTYEGGITLFRLDKTSCTLTQIQGPGPGGIFPIPSGIVQALTFSPDGRFLVVVSISVTVVPAFDVITVFSVDCSTLQPTQVSSLTTGFSDISALAFAPNCSSLAVLNQGTCESGTTGSVILYTFNQGVLTAPVVYPTNIYNGLDLEFSPCSYLAVASSGIPVPACGLLPSPGGISVYKLNGDPTLTFVMGPNANGTFGNINPISVSFSNDGACLAAGNAEVVANYVTLFSSNPSSGYLTQITGPNSQGGFNAGSSVAGVAYSQNLMFLAVANPDTGAVTILPTGCVLSNVTRLIREELYLLPCNPCI